MNWLLQLRDQLQKIGLVGERKALALLFLGFYTTFFALMSLLLASQLPEWMPCYLGLGAVYLTGFVALAADWFWGRWFALGLGYSGLWGAGLFLVLTLLGHQDAPPEAVTIMMIYGGTHGLIWVMLLGERMAASYEARPDWRERWHLDDKGVGRMKSSVTRAAASLPSLLIMWALAPREGAEQIAVLLLAGLGLVGVLRARTFGVLALATAGGLALSSALLGSHEHFALTWRAAGALRVETWVLGAGAGALLLAAAAPFAAPVLRFLARRPLDPRDAA